MNCLKLWNCENCFNSRLMGRTESFQRVSRLVESSSQGKSRKVREKQKDPSKVKKSHGVIKIQRVKLGQWELRRVKDSQVESIKTCHKESNNVRESRVESRRVMGCHGESSRVRWSHVKPRRAKVCQGVLRQVKERVYESQRESRIVRVRTSKES